MFRCGFPLSLSLATVWSGDLPVNIRVCISTITGNQHLSMATFALTPNRVFYNLDEIGNNVNTGFRVFYYVKTKISIYIVTPVSIEPLDL